ncbi:hypothetical protein V8F20_001809 [Naviculisporaceae sp. PSN 640]
MALSITSYSSPRQSFARRDTHRSEPVNESLPLIPQPRLDPPAPYPSRAYFCAEISEHHISLHFTNLLPVHIQLLRPLIVYHWLPRKSRETSTDATQTTVFKLIVKGRKCCVSYSGYHARRDFVTLQLDILSTLHSQGWMFRDAIPFAVQHPGEISKSTRPKPEIQLFPLERTTTSSNSCYWLMLSMHYHGEVWLVTSTPPSLRQNIVLRLSRSVTILREKNNLYRIALQEPFQVALLAVVDILEECEFTTFAKIPTWPPVIVLTRPEDTEEQTTEKQLAR